MHVNDLNGLDQKIALYSNPMLYSFAINMPLCKYLTIRYLIKIINLFAPYLVSWRDVAPYSVDAIQANCRN